MSRALLLTTTALAGVLISGCGHVTLPAVQSISSKLATDPAAGLPPLSATRMLCVAAVLRTDVKPGDLDGYIAGKRTFHDLRTVDNAKVQAGVDACIKA